MISLEQILLLQEKVENAVSKIEQLNAENAALRRKCAELTNALAAKTEQFSSFQNDQNKIEEGILTALKKLDAVESKVLESSAAPSSSENQNLSSNQKTENLSFENLQNVQPQAESSSEPEIVSENQQQVVDENQENQPDQSIDVSLSFENPDNQVSSENQEVPEDNSQDQNISANQETSENQNIAENPDASNQQNVENPENSEKPAEDSSSQPLFDIF